MSRAESSLFFPFFLSDARRALVFPVDGKKQKRESGSACEEEEQVETKKKNNKKKKKNSPFFFTPPLSNFRLPKFQNSRRCFAASLARLSPPLPWHQPPLLLSSPQQLEAFLRAEWTRARAASAASERESSRKPTFFFLLLLPKRKRKTSASNAMEVALILRSDASHIVERLDSHRLVRRKGRFRALLLGRRPKRRLGKGAASSLKCSIFLFFYLPLPSTKHRLSSLPPFSPSLSAHPPPPPVAPARDALRALSSASRTQADALLERIQSKSTPEKNRSRRQQGAISRRSRCCSLRRQKHRLRRRRRRRRSPTPSPAPPGAPARAAPRSTSRPRPASLRLPAAGAQRVSCREEGNEEGGARGRERGRQRESGNRGSKRMLKPKAARKPVQTGNELSPLFFLFPIPLLANKTIQTQMLAAAAPG